MIENLSQEQKDKLLEKLLKGRSVAKEIMQSESEEDTNTSSMIDTSSELEMYREVLRQVRDAINSLPSSDTEEEPELETEEEFPTEGDMMEKAATSKAVSNLKGQMGK